MKTSKSISVKSLNKTSTRDLTLQSRGIFYEAQVDFVKELQDACRKFNCLGIVVNKGVQNDEFYKTLKVEQKKIVTTKRASVPGMHYASTADSRPADDSDESGSTPQGSAEPTVAVVDALYDAQDELVEIIITRITDIPRELMQCINILAPYFRFFSKVSIAKSKINGYALHELHKLVKSSSLTDVCLDGSYLTESNYSILLSETSRLRHLSLSRCRVTDEVVEAIASKLHFKAAAGETLLALNLSSNQITDDGVKHLALALRTNRCLRYLNLASNRITDDGALPLFDTLKEFALLADDVLQKRARYIDYLRKKRAIYMKYFEDESRDCDEILSRKSITSTTPRKNKIGVSPKKAKKDPDSDDFATKLEMLSLEILGLFFDPFGPEFLKVKDGITYCVGNVVLCYLNLGYNSLSYLSLTRLQAVLLYQSRIKKPAEHGLLRVVIDGNPLPLCCSEMDVIGQALTNSVFRHMGAGERRRPSVSARKK